jgi:two-component system, LytTR family, response regulator
MESLTALIVDDEPAARRDLEEVLASIEEVRVVAQASDAAAAQHLARRHRPDLIFMDIQLPGADGFAALKGIDATHSCVIFTTAYSQFALRAFEVGATDYLLKPVETERCRRAIIRARETLQRQAAEDAGPTLEIEEHGARTRIPVSRIRLITADGNYLEIVHDQGRGLIRHTLEGLLDELPAGQFLRISRHQAVRPSAVHSVGGSGQRGLHLVLHGDRRELKVSRRRAPEVLAQLRPSTRPRTPAA